MSVLRYSYTGSTWVGNNPDDPDYYDVFDVDEDYPASETVDGIVLDVLRTHLRDEGLLVEAAAWVGKRPSVMNLHVVHDVLISRKGCLRERMVEVRDEAVQAS